MIWLALTLLVAATVAFIGARIRDDRRRAVTPAQMAQALERGRARSPKPVLPDTPATVPTTPSSSRSER
jgi:hypothetical protein